MNSLREDKFGMYLKTDLVVVLNAAALAFNPLIAAARTALNSLINAIAQADSTATRDITGYTAAKKQHKDSQVANFKIVRAGMMGYLTANNMINKFEIIDYTDTDIDKFRDSELYMKSDQLLDLALPVKNDLVTFGVTAAQVDSLDTLNDAWAAIEPSSRVEEGVSIAAAKDVSTLMAQTDKLLSDKLDVYMKVVQYNNPNVHSQYETARAIDNSGGSSGSDDFDLENYTIPTGGWVVLGNMPDGDLDVYIRNLSDDPVTICSGSGSGMCATGYVLNAKTLYKGPFSGLGLDPAMPLVQISNASGNSVIVRAGFKTED